MFVTASSNGVYFSTLKLEVAKDMSLRAQVDCGASNERQSLDESKLDYNEYEIPPTKMIRAATGASFTVKKGVVSLIIH